MKRLHFFLIKDHRRVGVLVPVSIGVCLVYAEDPMTLFPNLFSGDADGALKSTEKVVCDDLGTTYTFNEFSEQVIQQVDDVVCFPDFAEFK